MKTIREILESKLFLTDGGLETDMIFNHHIDLPHFAAFTMLYDPKSFQILEKYYEEYLELALKFKSGFILESPTWRANKDWTYKLGFSEKELIEANQRSIDLMRKIKI